MVDGDGRADEVSDLQALARMPREAVAEAAEFAFRAGRVRTTGHGVSVCASDSARKRSVLRFRPRRSPACGVGKGAAHDGAYLAPSRVVIAAYVSEQECGAQYAARKVFMCHDFV